MTAEESSFSSNAATAATDAGERPLTMPRPSSSSAAAAAAVVGAAALHNKVSYRFLGPTTKSLQLELYIWIVLMLLIMSNMQGVYRESFGTRGDVVFLVLAGVWCGKQGLWRWISCYDPSTIQSPTLCGLLAHIFTNYFMGGQIYDRPSPRQIAKFLNLRDGDTVPLLQTSQSSFDYASKLWSRRGGKVVTQVYRWLQECFTKPDSSASSLSSARGPVMPSKQQQPPVSSLVATMQKPPRSKFGRLVATCRKQLKVVRENAPSVQFLLYCAGLFAIKMLVRRKFQHLYTKETVATSLYSASLGVAVKQEQNMMKRRGEYQPRDLADDWWDDVWSVPVLCFMGLTMWVFGRIVPPLPDLVAGTHPLKDIRGKKTSNDSSAGNSNINSHLKGGGGAGGNSTSSFWTTMASYGFVPPTTHSWSESQAPIATVPRIYAHLTVFILRVVDVLWVVLWLPRTDAVCQLTGHCTSAWDWKERMYYLYPVGLTAPERDDRPSQLWPSQFGLQGIGSSIFVTVNVLTLVPLLLCTQSLLTNRSYWASWGYCGGEWEFVGHWDGKTSYPAWDTRTKYKKDDSVLYNKKIYKVTVQQPEGRPHEGFQRLMQTMLAQETGPVASSKVLGKMAATQLFNFFCQFLLCCTLDSVSSYGFLTALAANGLVTCIISVIGCVRPSALAKINTEASGVS